MFAKAGLRSSLVQKNLLASFCRRDRHVLTFGIKQQQFSTSAEGKSASDPQQLKEDFNHCVDLVRERDREGFLCGLLMPSKAQRAYFALRAFNVELASVKGGHNLRKKSDSGISDTPTTVALQMRMQWWKDALKEIYGEPSSARESADPALRNLSISCWNSPIVRALNHANQQVVGGFTRRFLDGLVDARALDLEVQQLRTLDESIEYAEETVANLLYLTLETVGVRDDEADEVALYAGIGIGLTTLLRATPYRLVHNEIPIPADLLRPNFPYKKALGGEENTLSESESAEWNAAVEQMTITADAHLQQGREIQSKVPRAGRPVLLPMVPSLLFMERLKAAQGNLMDPQIHEPKPLPLMLRLGRSWLTGSV